MLLLASKLFRVSFSNYVTSGKRLSERFAPAPIILLLLLEVKEEKIRSKRNKTRSKNFLHIIRVDFRRSINEYSSIFSSMLDLSTGEKQGFRVTPLGETPPPDWKKLRSDRPCSTRVWTRDFPRRRRLSWTEHRLR